MEDRTGIKRTLAAMNFPTLADPPIDVPIPVIMMSIRKKTKESNLF